MKGVVPGKVSAQLPNNAYNPGAPAESPLFGSTPAEQPVVILHLGARINHPLGVMAPGAKKVTNYFIQMNQELQNRREEFGFLGGSAWRGNDRGSNNTLLTILYFRSIEGLNAFAHDKIHREGWNWFNKWSKEENNNHISIFHEAFCAQPGGYETIYYNAPPVLLGAANAQVLNEQTSQTEYVSPLVAADTGPLRSQFGRMGRQ